MTDKELTEQYNQGVLKRRIKVKKWIKQITIVEDHISNLMNMIPQGKADPWLITAQDALQIKRNALVRSRVMRPITPTLVRQLKQVVKSKTKDGWYWPARSKDTGVRKERRYWACEELHELGFLKQRRNCLAYKITKMGLCYLKGLNVKKSNTRKGNEK
jgi:hypothetical protein